MQKYIANWKIKEFKAEKGDIFEEIELKGNHEHFLKNGTISVLGEVQTDKIDALKVDNEQLKNEIDALKLEKTQLIEAISVLEKKTKK